MDDKDFREMWQPDVERFELKYRKLVTAYASRLFRYESNGLDGFSGILSAFERGTQQHFWWGLPTFFLGNAMTWTVEMEDVRGQTRRRTAMCPLRPPIDGIDSCPFPTWSWLGWVGYIDFEDTCGYLDCEDAGLVFYRVRANGVPEKIEQNTRFRTYWGSFYQGIPVVPDYSWRKDQRIEDQTSDVPNAIFSRNLHPLTLMFWTSCAELKVEHDRGDQYGQPVPKLSDDGKTVKAYWPHCPSYLRDNMIEYVKFIVISRGPLEHIGGKATLSVLMVEEDADGLMRRRGMATVDESQWIELRNREWRLVFLC